MKKAFLGIMILFATMACRQATSSDSDKEAQAATGERHSIPQERPNPHPEPVASYSENITGEMGRLNNWKFAVALYEMPKTFTYRMQIKYAEIAITDTLQLPDFDLMPKPALQKGTDKYSCVIGFLDDKNTFREYKLVKVTDANVHITTLKYYSVQRSKAQSAI